MNSGAHVESIDAVREFLAALHTFAHEVRDAMGSFDLEVQASLEALVQGEPAFWQHELRKSDEAVSRAKIELERCRASKLPGGEARSCVEERKQLERVRLKRQYIEDKLDAVRKWGHQVRPQVDEYSARATQLSTVMDTEFPKAVLMLNRVLDALENYTATGPLTAGEAARDPAPVADYPATPATLVGHSDGPDDPPPSKSTVSAADDGQTHSKQQDSS